MVEQAATIALGIVMAFGGMFMVFEVWRRWHNYKVECVNAWYERCEASRLKARAEGREWPNPQDNAELGDGPFLEWRLGL